MAPFSKSSQNAVVTPGGDERERTWHAGKPLGHSGSTVCCIASGYSRANPPVKASGYGAQPKVFLFSAFRSSISIRQGYCFIITQQRRMTGDVIFTISLQFLHMKAIDFALSRPQKQLRSPAAQPSIE